MNKKKILGVILLSILFVLAGCSKKELSKIEMIEGSYNTDLGLVTISKDKKLIGFEGSGNIYFKEDIDKMSKDKLSDFFGYGATENVLKENKAVVVIHQSPSYSEKSVYEISWSDSDKTKKVDNITIYNTFKKTKKFGTEHVYKTYSGVRVQNK
ncbi:hypothetical protein [Streptococcus sp. Marseille-Q3533]|uniref:hypothetical protein n=1 Tax=Streptococcus sp. Marseille-Q3533 TaxID=2759692 RepID=UPI0020244E83|nr:hypothetical protein [Streptococcus sp. Marseille-Q3533]